MSKKGAILLVEDDTDDQEMMVDIIKGLGIKNHILCFANGKHALDYLTSATDIPFLILCDMNMPVMGGIELRKRITNSEALRSKSIPFIFLTTTASPQAVKEAYEMSVQGFFEKSTGLDEFKKLVKLIYSYWQQCKHPNS
jgi:CheY-like chemotaxis protein